MESTKDNKEYSNLEVAKMLLGNNLPLEVSQAQIREVCNEAITLYIRIMEGKMFV